MKYDIAVLGAGASGMMAAVSAKMHNINVSVVLIDRNEKCGKKVYITGKGRCNITNTDTDSEFLENVVRNSKFLYAAIKQFSPYDTVDFFTSRGMNVKTERGGRVFPESDKSSDVIKTFVNQLNKDKTKILLNTYAENISAVSDGFLIKTNNTEILCRKIILATGGMSYPLTGSDGSGYVLAKTLGHEIVRPMPALVPIVLRHNFDLQGLSLKNVSVKAKRGGQTVAEQFGEMLFTDKGISGPAVLSLSSSLSYEASKGMHISIDLKPALNEKQLDDRILRDFTKYSNRVYKNALHDLLPQRLINVIIALSGIDRDKPVHQITVCERAKIVDLLKNLIFEFVSLDKIEYGIITAGGVCTKQINPSTMESKIFKGLYYAGELIDVDALTGGYNIQIAFSTGYLAGKNAALSLI